MKLSEIGEKAKNLLRGKNASAVFIIIGALGILLILLSGDNGNAEKKSADKLSSEEMTASGRYERELEERLAETLSEIKGVGKVRVMITLSSSEEYIFAEEREQRDDSEKTSFVKSGEGGIIKKIEMPVITGAVIVCEGGGNSEVCEKVYEAVSVSLGISSNRISVLKMKC